MLAGHGRPDRKARRKREEAEQEFGMIKEKLKYNSNKKKKL